MNFYVLKNNHIKQESSLPDKKAFLILFILLVFALLIRIFFFTGHVFSDDAYYSKLSFNFLHGNFPGNYSGYPIFLLRINEIVLTALSFKLFGFNENASIIFPFLFSLLSIVLIFFLTKEFTKNNKIALLAAFLLSFFPTDIIFASINFADLQNAFFITLGIFLLFKANNKKKIYLAVLSGLSFFISIQFKENIYYTFILLVILSIYLYQKEKKLNPYILICIGAIISNFILEGIVYYFIYGDFLYRVHIMQKNYIYSYYDFFPYKIVGLHVKDFNFWNTLAVHYLHDIKNIFLRRFYQFLPLFALIASIFFFKKNKYKILIFWFIGILLELFFLTTSFTSFKPLDLTRSWYVFIYLSPVLILSAAFLFEMKKSVRTTLLILYFAASIFNCYQYQKYFDLDNLNNFKTYIRSKNDAEIYSDHFTKYSIDLIRGDDFVKRDKIIRETGRTLNYIQNNDLFIYNKKHIDELELQGYHFPDFKILNTNKFSLVKNFGDFKVYKSVQNQ